MLSLHSFTDVDWAGSLNDHKCTRALPCLFFLCTTPIVWKSGKQRIVARSSTKEKYKVLADDTAEIL
jgi:hypothetical protein